MAKGIANRTYNKTPMQTRIQNYLGESVTKQSSKSWITQDGIEIFCWSQTDFLVELEFTAQRISSLDELCAAVKYIRSNA